MQEKGKNSPNPSKEMHDLTKVCISYSSHRGSKNLEVSKVKVREVMSYEL